MKRFVALVFAGFLLAGPATAQDRADQQVNVEVKLERLEDGTARRLEIRHHDGQPPDTTVTIVSADELARWPQMQRERADRWHQSEGDNVVVIEREGGDIKVMMDGDNVWRSEEEGRRWREAPRESARVMRRFGDRSDARVFRFDGSEVEMDMEGFVADGERLHRMAPSDRFIVREEMAFGPERMMMGGDMTFGMNREIMEKEQRSRELARQVRNASDADRAALEAQLDAVLAEIFEAKQQQRAEQMQKMEEHLQKLREEAQTREQRRRDIIERRKRALLGGGDPLRW